VGARKSRYGPWPTSWSRGPDKLSLCLLVSICLSLYICICIYIYYIKVYTLFEGACDLKVASRQNLFYDHNPLKILG